MRILVLGAGGTGGYFGGRLAQSGADVTFLVRGPRAAQLQRDGLRIRSPLGDADMAVAHLLAEDLAEAAATRPFDLVLLSCKAYDLGSALDAIAPAMSPATTVLSVLNGLLHFDALDARFSRARVLGGLCFISAQKGPDGEVMHLGTAASITFGERDARDGSDAVGAGNAPSRARVADFAALCSAAGIDHLASDDIVQQLWNKFTFLATLAAGTCLMRAPVGTIVAGEGGDAFMRALHDECLAVAHAAGQSVPAAARDKAIHTLTEAGSRLKASMLRDLEAGQRVEAAHIVGDMWHRARDAGIDAPRLAAAWCHLQAYQSTT